MENLLQISNLTKSSIEIIENMNMYYKIINSSEKQKRDDRNRPLHTLCFIYNKVDIGSTLRVDGDF